MKKTLACLLVLLLPLTGCSQKADYPQANGELVEDYHGQPPTNWDKFLTFYDNVQNKRPDAVKVVKKTIEGDPITYTVDYDGKQMNITIDTTKDQFGPRQIQKATCSAGLYKTELENGFVYELHACKGSGGENVATFPLINERK